jgi:hypothetical protein
METDMAISFFGSTAQVSGEPMIGVQIHAKTKAWRPLRVAKGAVDANREMGAVYKTSVTLQAQSVNDCCHFHP